MTEPRGIRNNNALNVEYTPNTQWKGLDDPPTDGRFCRFVGEANLRMSQNSLGIAYGWKY